MRFIIFYLFSDIDQLHSTEREKNEAIVKTAEILGSAYMNQLFYIQ